ncbi:MAG: gliding motility-associated C-terminal domain-containing protein [Bacteroidales bacterium]|nr:gliding motility-associated C-terminal domain-containing protein [Bacteroidales bacterium]
MKKIITFLVLLCSISTGLFATHNRAGEITYVQIDLYTIELTITTYTYSLSLADRDELEVSWGDSTVSTATRTQYVLLPDNYKKNTYKATHTYPGVDVYEIVVEDPNRNFGVINIPNSVNVVFALKTIIQINPNLGLNSTPTLLNPPIDKAALYQRFIHDPAAFDADNDSLSFKLTACLQDGGEAIPDYTIPAHDVEFYVDEITGQLIWDSPQQVGIYNVAILVEEWREGVKIGNMIRDMQINVEETSNNPPVIDSISNFCVTAGDTLSFLVYASDPDNNLVNMLAYGGPFEQPLNPAEFLLEDVIDGTIIYRFTWATICPHVLKNPYSVTLKAYDYLMGGSSGSDFISLSDYQQLSIQVVAPAPENLSLEPTNNSVTVSWSPSVCTRAKGYDVYRKKEPSNWSPGECETGVPAYTGFEWIGSTQALLDTVFLDNNQEEGLSQGIEYCYRVVAFFEDGAESYASEEVCTLLKNGIPTITHVDILSTDSLNGDIYVAWAKPKELDISELPGPFVYLIYRSEEIWGENLSLIDSTLSIDDTTFVDTGLNTKDKPWSYKIEFWHNAPGNRFLIGTPQLASSTFLEILSSDNQLELQIRKNTPWIDSLFIIQKENTLTGTFDSLAAITDLVFVDDSLINGTEHCYKIKGIGYYNDPNIIYPLINHSQIRCGIPIDTIPPCSPALQVTPNCDELFNYLAWTNPYDTCSEDIIAYNIYYSPNTVQDLQLIATIHSKDTTWFTHQFNSTSLTTAGCYAVSAVDSFYNESNWSVMSCVDACFLYDIPNVFTPNSDGIHDLLIPITNLFIDEIDIRIFDRWGLLVYQTNDPEIKWDGRYLNTVEKVTDGVYYYICDVFVYMLSGLEHFTLTGFVHIYSGEQSTISPE